MIVQREEDWGVLKYDTSEHKFFCIHKNGKDATPYTHEPVVLNVDLNMKCNMACKHCVTKDFDEEKDLNVSTKIIDWINRSPFMVLVITGGEPLLPGYEQKLVKLLRRIQNKGLIIDTNGTIFPSSFVIDAILETNTLLRVSWDSTRPQDEIYFRHMKPNTRKNWSFNLEHYHKKIGMIKHFQSAGIKIAVQSVIHRKNLNSIVDMPLKLHEFSIREWYLQKFIPSYKAIDKSYELSGSEHYEITSQLINKCKHKNIKCITKNDRRHNSVALLVGDGSIYTQGEKPGKKIYLGTIDSDIRYFSYISPADHAERYYA